jgi:hypothetical protein
MWPAVVAMARALRFISLTCAALVLGFTLAHVLEAPGKRQLNGAEWTVVQNTFYAGFAVVGGIGEVLGLVSTCALAVLVRHRRGHLLLTAVAALAFLGTLLSFAFGNRPSTTRWPPGCQARCHRSGPRTAIGGTWRTRLAW